MLLRHYAAALVYGAWCSCRPYSASLDYKALHGWDQTVSTPLLALLNFWVPLLSQLAWALWSHHGHHGQTGSCRPQGGGVDSGAGAAPLSPQRVLSPLSPPSPLRRSVAAGVAEHCASAAAASGWRGDEVEADTTAVMHGLMISFAWAELVTTCLKRWVGRARPNFFSQ
jgi:hypothetical protein